RAAAERGVFAARGGRKKTSLRVISPMGVAATIVGRADRVDGGEKDEAAIVNYRLASSAFSVNEAYHGISLALIGAMAGIGQEGMKPVAGFNVQMVRKLCDKMPDVEGKEKNLDLATKPRGIFDEAVVRGLDKGVEQGWSEVVAAYLGKEGTLRYRRSTDVASGEELAGLMKHVEKRMGEMVDEILAGKVEVSPYLLRLRSPCANCGYRDVCRFEVTENRYRPLADRDREAILKEVAEEARQP
ncbi:MAG TPA: PD-(D/E)XK nuclease family protein, partial [Tepidisphaeraceae bacterium]|nr:PD-(D/E)XK nuclease family protein [Tepidisphaeraceae bacterium]